MSQSSSSDNRPPLRALVIGALGIVFGDIGTSPLYALKECFDVQHNHHAVEATVHHVFGILSLIFWSLILSVTVKYVLFVMRADRNGEGGVLSLLTLAADNAKSASRRRVALLVAGVCGAALLYGDGIITPAISVLSAVEGIREPLGLEQGTAVAITAAILIGLFAFQRFGTERVGQVFGPVMILWFTTLAALGIHNIVQQPGVLGALSPTYAASFLRETGWHGILVLGSVFLVVTGGETLYADMGHFGARPIRVAWFSFVLPALMLNYLGQGAWLLGNLAAPAGDHFNPIFEMAPHWARLPFVALATISAVIASQGLISGTYSLTLQAIQLGYLPRISIKHTSAHTRGQIYVPVVNWVLMFACLGLVFGFGTSTRLAAAYGVGVTLTMMVTTLLFFFVARGRWGWSILHAGAVTALFIVMEVTFFFGNAVKIPDGGWFPLVVAAGLFTVMTTWRKGRQLMLQEQNVGALTQEEFLQSLRVGKSVTQVSGTAVFLCGSRGKTPIALLHNLKHNKVIHERLIFLTLITDDVPLVPREQQVELEELGPGVWRLTGHYGFMQEPDVPQLLRRARNLHGFHCEADQVTFFLGRETIVPSAKRGMVLWREHLFAFLSKMSQAPAHFFKLPENRVVELGMRVRI